MIIGRILWCIVQESVERCLGDPWIPGLTVLFPVVIGFRLEIDDILYFEESFTKMAAGYRSGRMLDLHE